MAKWDSKRKLGRNQLLFEYYAAHRELSLREIGEAFNGITPQRVWELVKKEEERLGHKIQRWGPGQELEHLMTWWREPVEGAK